VFDLADRWNEERLIRETTGDPLQESWGLSPREAKKGGSEWKVSNWARLPIVWSSLILS